MPTHLAASTSYNDVNTALALCSAGDTLEIPAGSSTWASTLAITIPIVVLGAGSGLTNISGSDLILMQITSATDATVRVTGISFSHAIYGQNYSLLKVIGSGQPGGNSELTSVRVDNCSFYFGTRAVNFCGYVEGVIDHNTFLNNDIAVGLIGDNDASWARAIAFGTSHAVFVETNTFTLDASCGTPVNEIIYHNDGARSVVRYNTFNGTAFTGDSLFFDSHGNYENAGVFVDPLEHRGQPLIEWYSNTMACYKSYRMVNLRGGLIAFYDNTLTTVTGSANTVKLTEEDAWQTLIFDPLMTVWPGRDQNQFWHWDNTANGAALSPSVGNATYDPTFIALNRDFFNREPTIGDQYYSWASGYSGSTTVTVDLSSGYSAYTYPNPLVIAPPTAITATAISASAIALAWTDNSNNEDGFKIERSLDGSTGWTQIATVGAGIVAYNDTGLSGSTAYYYRVRAYNSDGNSAYSNTANDTTDAASAVGSGMYASSPAAIAFF